MAEAVLDHFYLGGRRFNVEYQQVDGGCETLTEVVQDGNGVCHHPDHTRFPVNLKSSFGIHARGSTCDEAFQHLQMRIREIDGISEMRNDPK
jgi:hypothetical protein